MHNKIEMVTKFSVLSFLTSYLTNKKVESVGSVSCLYTKGESLYLYLKRIFGDILFIMYLWYSITVVLVYIGQITKLGDKRTHTKLSSIEVTSFPRVRVQWPMLGVMAKSAVFEQARWRFYWPTSARTKAPQHSSVGVKSSKANSRKAFVVFESGI